MRGLLILVFFMNGIALSKAPECPLYINKKDCLSSVEETYHNFLDFIEQNYIDEEEEEYILVASKIKHFESLACEKTCIN